MTTALIVSCSKRKTTRPGAAIDVYDGQLFRILHKYPMPNVDIFILSALYGLIRSNESIVPYHVTMKETKGTIAPLIIHQWNDLGMANYSEVYACMGKLYGDVLVDALFYKTIEAKLTIQFIPPHPAPIGKMQAALKDFCLRMS